MNSLEVYASLHTLPVFTRVYAANRLPNSISIPCGIVVNTDPDFKPGSHWVAIYIDKFRNGEYFDSYGLPPFVSHHQQFLRSNCKRLVYNTVEMQSLNSDVCGQYCLLYLYFRAHARSLADFQKLFSQNTLENDQILRFNFKQYFKFVKIGKNHTPHKIQSCRRLRTHPSKASTSRGVR